jgi:hypothetical protein
LRLRAGHGRRAFVQHAADHGEVLRELEGRGAPGMIRPGAGRLTPVAKRQQHDQPRGARASGLTAAHEHCSQR